MRERKEPEIEVYRIEADDGTYWFAEFQDMLGHVDTLLSRDKTISIYQSNMPESWFKKAKEEAEDERERNRSVSPKQRAAGFAERAPGERIAAARPALSVRKGATDTGY